MLSRICKWAFEVSIAGLNGKQFFNVDYLKVKTIRAGFRFITNFQSSGQIKIIKYFHCSGSGENFGSAEKMMDESWSNRIAKG